MKIKAKHWLLIIVILTLAIRLIVSFSIPNLTYDSYFHLRQIEHIEETGLPLFQDDLSAGGKQLVFLPLFHYLMAFFTLILPIGIVAKIIPNLLFSTLPIISYFIAKTLTKDKNPSLFSALITAFLPITFLTNAVTPVSLFLPLIFLAIYFFLNIKIKNHLLFYIITLFCLCLTSSATFLIIVGFLIYLLLIALENKKMDNAELELMAFSLFFYVWTQFLFFKEVLIKEGISFIWQNIPSQIVQEYFPKLSVANSLILVSFIPFVAGVYVVYKALFQPGKQKSFLLISLVISTTLLAWFRLIQFKLSLAFFGMVLAILFASFYQEMINYVKKTKFIKFIPMITITAIIILLVTIIPPAISHAIEQDTPTNEEVLAFTTIKELSNRNSGVVSLIEESHLITYYSQRKNILDTRFTFVENVDQRFKDITSIYTTKFQTHALSLLNQYGINYIVLTEKAKEKFAIESLEYVDNECFQQVYKNNTLVYQVKCELKIEN